MESLAEGERLGHEREKSTSRSGSANTINHWSNAIVPYTIDAVFSTSERAVIAQGMRHIENSTCIRFVPRNGDHDYVEIYNGTGGCYASVNYWPGIGRTVVGLADGCVSMYIVVHELLHILTIFHEQQRPDRDDYITIDWTNIQPGTGVAQYYKDAWVGTDPATLGIRCSEVNETKDYANCWSGGFVYACDMPYDYKSVMHYFATAFAIDGSKNIMTSLDPSVTSFGSGELTSLDKKKLQCMYDCMGTNYSYCGGHFYGKFGKMKGSCCCGGDWIIRTENGRGISITFSSFNVPGNCIEEYLEIRIGQDDSGTLLGKFCNDNPPPSTINSNAVGVWAKFVKTNGSSADFEATWQGEKMTCCGDVWIDVGGYVGLYKPMSNGTTKNKAPVYETSSGGFLWYNGMRGWNLGPDYNAYLWLTVISPDGTFCPEDALTWQDYENSAWVDDENAEVRCSNCSIWPAYEECFTCCDSVTWTNTDGGSWTGQWDVYTTTPSNENRIVYQKADSPTYCLYFSGYWWIINTCSNIGAWSGYLFSEQTQKTCVHGNPAMWTGKGYVVTCSSSCSSNPPAAPSGATSDWDGVAKIG